MKFFRRTACAVTTISLLTSCVSSPSEVGGYERLPDLTTAESAGCLVSGRQPVWVYMGTRPQVRERAIQAFGLGDNGIIDLFPFRDLSEIYDEITFAEKKLQSIEATIQSFRMKSSEADEEEKEILDAELTRWESYRDAYNQYIIQLKNELDENLNPRLKDINDGTAGFLSARELRAGRIGRGAEFYGEEAQGGSSSYFVQRNAINANSIDIASRAYFGVQIRYMNLDTNVGVTGKTYYPAIKSRLDFATFEEQSKKRLDFITTAPQVLTDNAAKPSRVLIKNRQLLSPTPYLGGGVIAEFSLIAIGSGDIARSALAIVDNVSEVTGFSFVSQIGAFGRVVKDGIDKILNVDEGSRFRAGVATSFEDPIIGYWVLMWPQQDWERQILDYFRVLFAGKNVSSKVQKRLADYLYHNGVNVCDLVIGGSLYDLNGNETNPKKRYVLNPNVEPQLYLKVDPDSAIMTALRKEFENDDDAKTLFQTKRKPGGENKDGESEKISRDIRFWNLGGVSWALIEFEAFESHPAIFRVPGLSSSYREVTEAFSSGSLEDAWRRLGEFQVFVRRSADLTELDKARLVAASNRRFHDYCKFLAENFQPLRETIKNKDKNKQRVCDEYSPKSYDDLPQPDETDNDNGSGNNTAGGGETDNQSQTDSNNNSATDSEEEAVVEDVVFLPMQSGQKILSRSADYLSDRTPVQIIRYEGPEEIRPWRADSFSAQRAAEFAKVLKDGAFEDLIREYNLTTAIPLNWSPAKERNFDELGYEFRRLEILEQASSP